MRGVIVIPQELFSTKPMKQIVEALWYRMYMKQVVKGMVEQECMQKHTGDATGQDRQDYGCTSGNVTPCTDHPNSSEDCGSSTNAIP